MVQQQEFVKYETRGQTAIITINRPERMNSLGALVTSGLNLSFERANNDHDVRVIVLTGAGDRAFCAGGDLKAMADSAAFGEEATQERGRDILGTFELTKPVVAAINGYCLGGGLGIAMRCDIRVASENASFGLPEVKRGIHSPAWNLSNLIPASLAMEMAIIGDPLDAKRALEVGLVSRVVPHGQALDEAINVAQAIADNAPIAVRVMMNEVRRIVHSRTDPLEDLVRYGIKECFDSEDSKEGARAFAEKRKPNFAGR
jgi:enoyl-CoA hydratase/carnithine racemase